MYVHILEISLYYKITFTIFRFLSETCWKKHVAKREGPFMLLLF
jgi:hypothetical protein